MKIVLSTTLFMCGVVSAFAHPEKLDGRWSTKKGNCSEEVRIIISPKAVSRYEEVCKILKEEVSNPLNVGKEYDEFGLNLSCSSEGEVTKDKLWLGTLVTTDQLKISFDSDGPSTHRWIYRCKR